jgi:ribosomal protein S18 acetylase RimI-like enzyme
MQLSIRPVRLEDAENYTACHIACWRAAYQGIVPDQYLDAMQAEQQQRTEQLRQSLLNPGSSQFFCLVDGSQMIGRLIIGKSRDDDLAQAGEVTAIYLLPEYWGQGLGRMLMDFAINTLRQSGYQQIILWVLQLNSRARRFYERYGFVADGQAKSIELGKPLVQMRYRLD